MLTKQGAKLLDFGLAKQNRPPLTRGDFRGVGSPVGDRSPIGDGLPLPQTKSESLTEEGMILGTLEYMAPEQVEGKETDSRTDIFAFGVVMYEMATGRKAFEGDSKASLTAAILTNEPPPITKIQPLTPAALDRVVRGCLAKDPEERWQSARDLRKALEWVSQDQPTAPGRPRRLWVWPAVSGAAVLLALALALPMVLSPANRYCQPALYSYRYRSRSRARSRLVP